MHSLAAVFSMNRYILPAHTAVLCTCVIVRACSTHDTVQNASLVGRCVQAEVDGEASCIGRVTACYPAQDGESLYLIE
jgi:hypothetical protein